MAMVERVPGAVNPRGQEPGARKQARRPELDALRLLVIFGLIPIHAAYIFTDLFDYYVRSPEPNMAFTVVVIAAALWAMPLLFVTSGMTLSYALRKRTPGAFIVERTKRLLVPFIFGVVVVIPPMTYIELLAKPGEHPSYWSFLARFLDDARPAWDFPYLFAGRADLFETAHLYFIYQLFVYSLLLLPLLLWLRRPRSAAAIDAIVSTLTRPGVILLLGIPMALLQGWLGAEPQGGWNRWVYFLAVLYGCLIAQDSRIMGSIVRQRRVALGAAVALTLVMWLWASALDEAGVDAFEGRGIAIAWRILEGVAGWSWVVAILGISAAVVSGRRAVGDLAASGDPGILARLGRYAQEGVLPIYVLHLTVVVAVGYLVIQWSTNTLVKYVVIVAASFAGTLLLFELVRRIPLTRFLLGMKPRGESLRPAGPPPQPGVLAGSAGRIHPGSGTLERRK
jgi:surface polysaccharide O-acyltransferase-like enzyme